ncbi:MAG TPA: DPP IV N-terminal domain-containing protein, partial [Bryobacteraceae bacterium]
MAKLLIGPFLVLAAFAQTPTIEQSLGMRSITSAQISPDGRFVAYTAQQASWDQDEFVQQIWVSMVATGERYQLTSAKKSSQNPKWSPDSKRLAFASERDGKRQIYIINPLGGEPQQLTTEENDVRDFEWAPDGSAIAYISSGPESKAKKDRKDKYGDFEVVENDYAMMRIWLIKTPAEIPADPKQRPKAEPLTEGDKFSVEDLSWAPDSKRIAFSAQRDPDLSSSATEQLYLVDLADKHVRKLLDSTGPNQHPRWSPDGRQIAFNTAGGDPFYYYANRRVAVTPVSGGPLKILSTKFDEDANLIDWGPDGIYFSALQKGAAHVFRLNPANQAIERITAPDSFYAS